MDYSNKQKGFTLLEVVVASAIFGVLIVLISGIFVSMVKGNRERLGQQVLQQDIQNFFETLDREARTGFGDTFTASSSDTLEFKNQALEEVTYTLDSAGGVGIVKRSGTELTSSKTDVRELAFYADAATADGDILTKLGMITVSLYACPAATPSGEDSGCIRFQTTVTSRQSKPAPSS